MVTIKQFFMDLKKLLILHIFNIATMEINNLEKFWLILILLSNKLVHIMSYLLHVDPMSVFLV